MVMTRTLAVLAVGLSLVACKPDPSGKAGDSAGGGVGGAGGGEGGDDAGSGSGSEVQPDSMVISGLIRVQLYREESNGDITFMAWEDSGYDETFPFGAYFVGAVAERTDNDEAQRYVGTSVVLDPTPGGSEYAIRVEEDELTNGEFRLYAALDYYDDRIIHSWDPIGLHPDTFELTPDADLSGMDITVLAPWADFQGQPASTSDDARRDCSDGPTIEGPVDVLRDAEVFEGIVFLFEATNNGDGAMTAAYEMQTCANQGYMYLKGMIDSNVNGLIDPDDLYGTYAPSVDTSGNPVTVASEDFSEMRIQIPLLEEGDALSVVPFVSLSGDLGVGGGTFDDLPPGTTLVVAALKRRPQGGIDLATIEGQVYDMQSWEWPDLQGNTTVSYDLTVPSNTLMYLWAFADTDANGRVNEAGEPIASGGIDDNGRLATDTTSQTADLFIGFAPTR